MECARTARMILAGSVLLAASGGARAEEGVGPWVDGDEAELRLVSAVSAVAPGAGTVPLALQMRLAEGWRIYWRTPGASGLPPQLDWSGSENLDAVAMSWPAPVRFVFFGQESYGYRGEVLFPLAVRLVRPGEAAAFRLMVMYLVCREVCIPGETELALDLAAGAARTTTAAAEIDRHASRLPAPAAARGLTIRAIAEPQGLAVIAEAREAFAAPDLFLEWQIAPGHRRPDLPRPALSLAEGGREATFRFGVHPPLVRPGTPLRVTLVDGTAAVEAEVTVEPPLP